jgi:hypothetical protein
MRALWITVLSFGVFSSLFWGTSGSQHVLSDEPKASGTTVRGEAVEHGVPPDIKVGVRIQFVSGQVFSRGGDRSVKVAKIEGNWGYMEGAMYHSHAGGGGTVETTGAGWVNLSKLDWYRIVEEKKGS